MTVVDWSLYYKRLQYHYQKLCRLPSFSAYEINHHTPFSYLTQVLNAVSLVQPVLVELESSSRSKAPSSSQRTSFDQCLETALSILGMAETFMERITRLVSSSYQSMVYSSLEQTRNLLDRLERWADAKTLTLLSIDSDDECDNAEDLLKEFLALDQMDSGTSWIENTADDIETIGNGGDQSSIYPIDKPMVSVLEALQSLPSAPALVDPSSPIHSAEIGSTAGLSISIPTAVNIDVKDGLLLENANTNDVLMGCSWLPSSISISSPLTDEMTPISSCDGDGLQQTGGVFEWAWRNAMGLSSETPKWDPPVMAVPNAKAPAGIFYKKQLRAQVNFYSIFRC
jgi:hypothetical protein